MNKFDKKGLINSFFFRGKGCVEDAKYLFDNKPNSHYGILLIHGIELLLKAYILIKENSHQNLSKFLKELGHNYDEIYKRSIEYGDELKDIELKRLSAFLTKYYYPNTIEARYVERSKLLQFQVNTFRILEEKLINPINAIRRSFKVQK